MTGGIDLSSLLAAGRRWAFLPHEGRISLLDAVAEGWLSPSFPERQEALRRLPDETGLSPASVSFGLECAFSALRGQELSQLPRPRAREAGFQGPLPGVAVHLQAANVFTAALPRLFGGLLCGFPSVLKAPWGEGSFSRLVAESICRLAGPSGKVVEAWEWKGGDGRVEAPLFAQAAVVLLYGSDETVASVRARIPPGVSFYGFGHRMSVGVLGADSTVLDDVLMESIAVDTLAYDQKGCLSLRVLWVEEGGAVSPREVARLLAERGFPQATGILPPGRGWEEEAEARFLALSTAEFTGEVWRGNGFAVEFQEDPEAPPPPVSRVLAVRPLPGRGALRNRLLPHSGRIQGIMAATNDEFYKEISILAAEVGGSRVTLPGFLQRPDLAWPQDGVPLLQPFLSSDPSGWFSP